MDIISDVHANKDRIVRILENHGCSAEHNFYCYIYNTEPWESLYVFIIREGSDEYCMLTKYDKKALTWYFVVEPVAPEREKVGLLLRSMDYAFSNGAKKIRLELTSLTRKSLLNNPRLKTDFKDNKLNYTLVWPVFNMLDWNGDKMEGKDWKDMRYYWNRFFKEHKVEFVTSNKSDKIQLKNLVYEWKKKRKTGDKAFIDYYLHAIDNDFAGYDVNRIMVVDGKPAAITAGFKSKAGYYSSIGLYDVDIDRCNEIANMDDLINLKKLGYKLVDFGGQESKSLDFKKKFRPTYYYKTHIFSIVRREK